MIYGFTDEKDIESQFNCTLPTDAAVLFASYGCSGYEGEAFVLYRSKGKLWEVHGSHCSCNGLYDQWSPEEASVLELANRAKNGSLISEYMGHDNGAAQYLQHLIDMMK